MDASPASPYTQGNGLAVSGFLLSFPGSILGLLLPILRYVPPLALGLVFHVLSGASRERARRPRCSAKGLAIAGVVLGVIAITLGIVGTVEPSDALSLLGR